MHRIILTTILFAHLLALSCGETKTTISRTEANPDFYVSQSECTDPGELAWLLEGLPDDNETLCRPIKKQFIHPVEIGPFQEVIPEERYFEDTVYQSVRTMLAGLLEYDSSGLTAEREPKNRLVVACLHHSLMFASILRERGIPVRLRVGFAPYIGRMAGIDINISHVVCEVWNNDESRWMYIDPDRQLVDFPSDDFITGAEAWLRLRTRDLDVKKFRSAFFEEEQSILDMLRLDFLYGLRQEVMYWGDTGAPEVPKLTELSRAELRALDRIAQLLEQAGAHTEELRHLRDSVEFLF